MKKFSLKLIVYLVIGFSLFSCFEKPMTKVAVGSCYDPDQPAKTLDWINREKFDHVVFLGDNTYINEHTPEGIQKAYDQLKNSKVFQSLVKKIDGLAVWDDNDYGQADGDKTNPHKEIARKLFFESFQIPDSDIRRSQEGLYFSRSYQHHGKTLQMILLDTRSFRDPWTEASVPRPGYKYDANPDPEKTILGEVQWSWLQQELKKPADLRMVFSSIQVLNAGHGFEKWGNFPTERQKLLETLKDREDSALILYGGDRHHSGFYHESKQDFPNGIFEVLASGFNKKGFTPDAESPFHVSPSYMQFNYTLTKIDWVNETVIFEIRDEDNKVVQDLSLNFKQLGKKN